MRHASAPSRPQGKTPALAWVASIGMHLLVVTALWSCLQPQSPFSVGRRVGALMVRLVTVSHTPRPSPQSSPSDEHPQPHRPDTKSAKPMPVRAQTSPATTNASDTPTREVHPEAPKPPSTPPLARPGAAFASLFAPIISRPIGTGRWGAPPSPPPEIHPDQMARQQALAARRANVMQRIQGLQMVLMQQPLHEGCDVQLVVATAQGLVQCTQADDAARVAGQLSEFLSQGTPSASTQADLCLSLDGNRVTSRACSAPTPPN